MASSTLLKRLRVVLSLFIAALLLSGLTAFPLLRELDWIVSILGLETPTNLDQTGGLNKWILIVRSGLRDTYTAYPWIAYGTDWLAFAHIAIAIFFWGPLKDPVRNVWVLHAGVIACVLIIPLAMICGEIRGIPLAWRLIDCSFGVLGALPLLYCINVTKKLERGSGLDGSRHNRIPK